MVSHDKMKEWYKRLDSMKQETLLRYLRYINLDNEMDLYDVMLRAIVQGDLIDKYPSYVYHELSEEEIKKLNQSFQENASLCFYDGDINYWLDSIEGVSLQDFDLIIIKLFDHFDFLLQVIKDGGDNSIKLLKEFQNSNIFQSNSVIDVLRNTFDDDEALEKCIIEVSKDHSLYKGLSGEEKSILFMYPNHVLYEREKDNIYVTDPFYLKKMIASYFGDNDLLKSSDLVSLVKEIGDDVFENAVSNLYFYSIEEVSSMSR